MTASRFAIVAAMPQELAALIALFHEYRKESCFGLDVHHARHGRHELLFALSGVGKANAASTMTLLLTRYGIDRVINIGSAGGLDAAQRVLDVVAPAEVVYTDVDVTPMGFAYGQMYGEPPRYAADEAMLEQVEELAAAGEDGLTVHRGVLGTADAFIHRPEQLEAIRTRFHDEVTCVDMEGAAVAQICHRFHAPFLILRALSDTPGPKPHDAAMDFKTFLDRASDASARICLDLIERL